MCVGFLRYVFLAAWFIVAPVGVLLIGYAHQALIESYGWGVFYRYSVRDQCGSLLSRRERRMLWCGVALLSVFVLINIVTIALCRVRT
jgi:hypothetical protein